MKNDATNEPAEHIVRYRRKPLTDAQKAELEALANRPDSEIDLSDIPEADDAFFENALRNPFLYPPVRLDASVVEWFRKRHPSDSDFMIAVNKALKSFIKAQSDAEPDKKAG